jgi:DUF2075 family protein
VRWTRKQKTELLSRLPDPHSGQIPVLASQARFKVVNFGRRSGKSVIVVRRAVTVASKGQRFGYFAATYKILADVFRDMCKVCAGYGRVNKSDYRIELDNGGIIECWSLESDEPGRSRKYHEIAIDEAAHAPKLEVQWRDCIRPTLSDYAGPATFFSTPKGRNFFYLLHLMATSGDNPEWEYFHAPTACNPYISADEIESARTDPSMTEQSFAQEYLAEFLESSGAVFRRVLDAVAKGSIQTGVQPGRSYALGLDLAHYQDFTVLTVFDDTGLQVYFERFNQMSWARQVESVIEICVLYNISAFSADATGVGDAVVEQLQTAVNERNAQIKDTYIAECKASNARVNTKVIEHISIPDIEGIWFTPKAKGEIISNYATDIECGRLQLLDVPVQTNELLAYEYTRTAAGNLTMNAPLGMHDDCVISGALANKARGKCGPAYIPEEQAQIGSQEDFMRKQRSGRKYRK